MFRDGRHIACVLEFNDKTGVALNDSAVDDVIDESM